MSNTTVTLTVTDPSGQLWANGTVTWQLFAKKPVFFNGVALDDSDFLPQTVALDGSGFGTFTVKDNSQMTPAPQVYRITVNPNATTEGVTIYAYLSGSSQDISTQIDMAIGQPNVLPAPIPFAYRDSNIVMRNGVGELYYNTGSSRGLRVFNGSAWEAIASAGVTTINGMTGPINIVGGTSIGVVNTSGTVTINFTGTVTGGITQLTDDVIAGPGMGSVSARAVNLRPQTPSQGITWASGDSILDTGNNIVATALAQFNVSAAASINMSAGTTWATSAVGVWSGSYGGITLTTGASGFSVSSTGGTILLNPSVNLNLAAGGNTTSTSNGLATFQGTGGLKLNSGTGDIDFSLDNGTSVARAMVVPSITDVTGSRSFGTQFQNNTKQALQVTGYGLTSISSTGTLIGLMGPSSASTTFWENTNTASVSTGRTGFSFIVPPGWFYQINSTGDITGVGVWVETNLGV